MSPSFSRPPLDVYKRQLLHLRYTSVPMSAAECQRALSQATTKGLGVDYRKNIDGLLDLVDENRAEAIARAARLDGHHDSLGNVRPSDRNPATRVGDVFEELGPYLG